MKATWLLHRNRFLAARTPHGGRGLRPFPWLERCLCVCRGGRATSQGKRESRVFWGGRFTSSSFTVTLGGFLHLPWLAPTQRRPAVVRKRD